MSADRSPAQLIPLLDRWRETPHPLLARAIEVLTAVHAAPLIPGGSQKETIANLQRILAGPNPAGDLGAALKSFPAGNLAAATAQLEQLQMLPRDPRIATRLLDLFADPPYRTPKARAWWAAVVTLLIETADPRSHARAEAVIERIHASFAEPMATWVKADLQARLAQLDQPQPALSADEQAAIEAIIERNQTDLSAQQSLHAAVLAEPDDVDLRLVFADACLTVNDPRGEVIMLQHAARTRRLTPIERKRLKQLIAAHQSEWLGDMGRVLLKASIEWELGFLASATLSPKHIEHVQPLIGDPRWATVRALELGKTGNSDAARAAQTATHVLVLHPACKALRSVTGKVPAALAEVFLAGPSVFPLHTLTAYASWGPTSQSAHRDRIRHAPTAPNLRTFDYRSYSWRSPKDADWLLDSPLGTRLESLAVTGDFAHLEGWLDRHARYPERQIIVQDFHGHQQLRIEQSAKGLELHARFRWPGMRVDDSEPFIALCHALGRLAPGSVHTLTWHWTRDYGPRRGQIAALKAAVAQLQPVKLKHPKGI